MDIYNRIISMLLEAKIESYLERLDEMRVKKTRITFKKGEDGWKEKKRTQLGKSPRNAAEALAKKAERKAAAAAKRTPQEAEHAKASSQHAPTGSGNSPTYGRRLRHNSRKSVDLDASAERKRQGDAEERRYNKEIEDTEDSLRPGKI